MMSDPVAPYLSVVIPAYNEAKRIGPSLARVLDYLQAQTYSAEVVVVYDGSTDDTVNVVEAQARIAPLPLRVLRNEGNRGKGYSVRHGMMASSGQHALFSDADLSTPIEELERLLAPIQAGEAEIAIASRGLAESVLEKRQPIYRELMGRTFNKIVRVLAVPGIADTQCGFKLFTRQAVELVFPYQCTEGFGFDVELLFLARRRGLRIAEIPVHWVDSPASKVHPLKDATGMFLDVLRVRTNTWRGRYREKRA